MTSVRGSATAPLDQAPCTWCVADESVALKGADGFIHRIRAVDIHAAEFNEVRSFRGLLVDKRPSDALQHLRFQRGLAAILINAMVPIAPAESAPLCRFALRVGDSEFQIAAHAIRNSDHIIAGNRWVPFSSAEISELELLLDCSIIQAETGLTLRQLIRLRKDPPDNLRWVNAETITAGPAENGAPLSNDFGLRIAPYPYQARGIRWLNHLVSEGVGGVLADEMGLGKTLQAIAVVAANSATSSAPCLVVTTASLTENWRREFARFAPDVKVRLHRGPDRTGFPAVLAAADCVITTYDCVVRDEAIFGLIKWRIVFLDEAQYIKNPDSFRARAVRALARDVGIAITGTPLENRLLDLWSISDFANPGLLGDRAAFETMTSESNHSATTVADALSPFMLRRRVLDVRKDLPEKHEVVTAILMSQEEGVLYEQLRIDTEGSCAGRPSFGSLMKLRQFCAHPSLVGLLATDTALATQKLERLSELLDVIAASNEKVLIFAPFQAALDLIAQMVMTRFAVGAVIIDGRTPVDARQQLIDVFQAGPSFDVLLLNPRAAGVGLNITAANHVIHFCPEWNPAIVDQATARAYRSGQERPVTVYRLFYADTVEDVMEARLATKRELISEAVLDSDADPLRADELLRALSLSPIQGGFS
jgi:SNF2 family DNA or RNA helicase